MVDRVVRHRVSPPDRARECGICLHEVTGQKERAGDLLATQHGKHRFRALRIAAAVEGKRDHALTRLEPDELPGDDRGR
jgi:hypothetical protein